MLSYNHKLDIYKDETLSNEGFTETKDTLYKSFRARVTYNDNKTRKVKGNDNIEEIITDITVIIPSILSRAELKEIKDTGHLEIDGYKYRLRDYQTSDIMRTTTFYGLENE